MGKRSDYDRLPRDFYPTPKEGVFPLLRHILPGSKYIEPCAGDGALMSHLYVHAGMNCLFACDIEPQDGGNFIKKMDALDLVASAGLGRVDYIITNPTWQRQKKDESGKRLPSDQQPMHMLIEHFRKQAPTWLLLDADWMHTIQAAPYMDYCHKVQAVGRLKWIPGSRHTGKDNCCWYLFMPYKGDTVFYGRG